MKAIQLIYYILILYRISTVISQSTPPQSACPLSGADEKFLIQRRMQGLRASLLGQLGITSTNVSIPTNVTLSRDQLDTYFALTQAASSMEAERERRCQSEEIFAQPITTIVGEIQDSSSQYKSRRNVKRYADNNILSTIDLRFNFNLKDSLTTVTRGDFLLYQVAPSPHDNIADNIQYVEIKAVFESVGLRTVVAAKNMDINDEGFQSFDISPAIKLWIEKQINGTVHLEITITCLSSKRCASKVDQYGNLPAPIKFEFDSPAHKPRLVIVSQNPLEVENRRRFRRQSNKNTDGVSLCIPNQSTCCVKSLTINFAEDLNMPFIILPKTFPANYCEGICPITAGGDLMTPELYGFLSRLSNHPAASIEPCCAGNKFKPLVVVMPDPKNPNAIVVEELQQVTVESCRCA